MVQVEASPFEFVPVTSTLLFEELVVEPMTPIVLATDPPLLITSLLLLPSLRIKRLMPKALNLQEPEVKYSNRMSWMPFQIQAGSQVQKCLHAVNEKKK